jgi:hypothetical protein
MKRIAIIMEYPNCNKRYVPATASNANTAKKPYHKFVKRLPFIVITNFGLFMLFVLLVGLLT